MNARKLSDQLSVGPAITVKDVKTLAGNGFKHIICNLPDGEIANQAIFSQIKKAAKKEGIAAYYIPVRHGPMNADNVAKMKEYLETLDGPIFAYCRSGNRSTMLYKAANRGEGGGFFKRLFG